MDLLLSVGITLIVVILLLQAATLLVSANRLLKLPLWTPRKTPCLRTASGGLLPILEAARAEMEKAGFRYMHSWRERSIIASEDIPASYCDVYHHLAQDVLAEVYPNESMLDSSLYTVFLWNTYVDGKTLLTINGSLQTRIPYPSRVSAISDKSGNLAGQLATHLHVRELITVQRSDPADAPGISQNLAERWLVRLEREGKIYQRDQRGEENIYGFRLWPALKLAWQLRRESTHKSMKSLSRSDAASTLANIDGERLNTALRLRDRHAFIRSLCTLRSMRAPRWYQYSSFALSALLFLALGTWWWGIAGAIVIGAVIALHESGHWLAMKMAGFRDVQVFFVPGMGGITSGEKHEARPLTHLLVYLAGPLPGLLLSLAGMALIFREPGILNTAWGPLLSMATMASFMVNGFNLLPLLPLDGGRVIELLLMARLPWLRFLFALCSGLAMLGYGLYSGDKVLAGIGMFALIGAQFQYKFASAAALLSRQNISTPGKEKNFSQAAADLFDFLSQEKFSKWSYTSKLTVGQTILSRYLGGLPGWKESSAGMALYLACIILPLAALFAMFYTAPSVMTSMTYQGMSALLASDDASKPVAISEHANGDSERSWQEERMKQREARSEKISAAQGSERADILRSVLDEAREADPEDALRIAKVYYAENNNSLQPTYLHADAALAMANAIREWSELDDTENAKKNDTDIANYLQEAEAILRARLREQGERRDARLLAEVLQARDIDTENPAQLSLKEEVVNLLAKDKKEDDTELLQARQMLARAYYKIGRTVDAENQLHAADEDFSCASKDTENILCRMLKSDQVWLLLNLKKLAPAQDMLKSLAYHPKQQTGMDIVGRDIHEIKWSIAMHQKDYNQARLEALALAQSPVPGTGNWLTDLFMRRAQPIDFQQSELMLMLIEALRAKGEQEEANKIAGQLQEALHKARTEPGNIRSASSEIPCRTHVQVDVWKSQFQQTLLNIEQRETRCTPRASVGQMSR
ncbi:hypothetical protein ACO0LL_29295 [Undibacterium sp. TC4M20W]|uniref:hypothetical protein n=1 Tax=Undibacterium sp. TC4M20W TaxID=3413052 RepID=UPI003BF39497